MPEPTYPRIFDTGNKLDNFMLSNVAVISGILVANTASEATLAVNYIEQTASDWQEVPYDETNPRHNRQLVARSAGSTPITGIMDSGSYVAPPANPLTDAILNGTLTADMTAQAASAIAAQEASPGLEGLSVALTKTK